jgi:hypothetical protein
MLSKREKIFYLIVGLLAIFIGLCILFGLERAVGIVSIMLGLATFGLVACLFVLEEFKKQEEEEE